MAIAMAVSFQYLNIKASFTMTWKHSPVPGTQFYLNGSDFVYQKESNFYTSCETVEIMAVMLHVAVFTLSLRSHDSDNFVSLRYRVLFYIVCFHISSSALLLLIFTWMLYASASFYSCYIFRVLYFLMLVFFKRNTMSEEFRSTFKRHRYCVHTCTVWRRIDIHMHAWKSYFIYNCSYRVVLALFTTTVQLKTKPTKFAKLSVSNKVLSSIPSPWVPKLLWEIFLILKTNKDFLEYRLQVSNDLLHIVGSLRSASKPCMQVVWFRFKTT